MNQALVADRANHFMSRLQRVWRASCMLYQRLFTLFLGAVSLALLAFAISRRPFANEDGALYLMIAQRIDNEGFASGLSLFDSSVYSALIAAVHSVTGLPLQWGAYVLSGVFVSLITLAFVDICQQFYNDKHIAPWAALLLLSHPKLNIYFAFIVRDLGYWALLLSSWSLFLRHLSDARLRWLGGWALFALMATLFKPEGFAFGLILPLAILFDGRSIRSRVVRILGAYSLLLALPLLAMFLQSEIPLGQVLCCIHERPLASLQEIPRNFIAASEIYADSVIHRDSRKLAAVSLAGGLVALFLAKILKAFGTLQLLLLVFGWRMGVLPVAVRYRAAYCLLLVTAASMPALFLASQRFLDTRYLMLMCFMLFVPAARALQMLAYYVKGCGIFFSTLGLALLVGVLAADFSQIVDKEKPYMIASYQWIQVHVESETPVFTNDRQFAAVATDNSWDLVQVESATSLIESRQVPSIPDRLWIIHVRPRQAALAESLHAYQDRLLPITTFGDKGGAIVHVYRERALHVDP